MLRVLYERGGTTVSSDFARAQAHTLAALASAGYVSTETFVPEAPYGRVWHLTGAGIRRLER